MEVEARRRNRPEPEAFARPEGIARRRRGWRRGVEHNGCPAGDPGRRGRPGFAQPAGVPERVPAAARSATRRRRPGGRTTGPLNAATTGALRMAERRYRPQAPRRATSSTVAVSCAPDAPLGRGRPAPPADCIQQRGAGGDQRRRGADEGDRGAQQHHEVREEEGVVGQHRRGGSAAARGDGPHLAEGDQREAEPEQDERAPEPPRVQGLPSGCTRSSAMSSSPAVKGEYTPAGGCGGAPLRCPCPEPAPVPAVATRPTSGRWSRASRAGTRGRGPRCPVPRQGTTNGAIHRAFRCA